jgi:hypothetical protein
MADVFLSFTALLFIVFTKLRSVCKQKAHSFKTVQPAWKLNAFPFKPVQLNGGLEREIEQYKEAN